MKIVCFLIGVGTLTPWNALISPAVYWDGHFSGLLFYGAFAYNGVQLIFLLVTRWKDASWSKLSFRRRFDWGFAFGIMSLVGVVTAVTVRESADVEDISVPAVIIMYVAILFMGVAAAITMSAAVGFANVLNSAKFVPMVAFGGGVGGIVMNLLVLMGTTAETVYWLMGVGIVTQLIALACGIKFSRHGDAYLRVATELEAAVSPSPADGVEGGMASKVETAMVAPSTIASREAGSGTGVTPRDLMWMLFSLCMVYVVTLGVFPSYVGGADVAAHERATAIALAFMIFNSCDTLARVSPVLPFFRRMLDLAPQIVAFVAILRVGFVVFFVWFSRHRVTVSTLLIGSACLGITNGCLNTIALSYPGKLNTRREQDKRSRDMVLMLNIGLTLGSLMSAFILQELWAPRRT